MKIKFLGTCAYDYSPRLDTDLKAFLDAHDPMGKCHEITEGVKREKAQLFG